MNAEALKHVLDDQERILREGMSTHGPVPRDVADLKKYLSRPNVLAILGMRRAGKSTLAHMLLSGERYGFVNFDDERLMDMGASDLNLILEVLGGTDDGEPEFLLFDEIQNVRGWELFVTRLRNSKKVIITGSNANLLSGELSTHLTGRYIDFVLMPFSFREYLRFSGMEVSLEELYGTSRVARVKRLLNIYMRTGGLPEAYSISPDIIPRVYQDIIAKDAVLRFGIRNSKTFGELARYLISNHSCEFTYSKLQKVTSVGSVLTVKDYVEYLRSVYLIFVLERYSPKLKEQMRAPKKVYCMDNGIATSIGFSVSENVGSLMENLVAVHLHRTTVQTGSELELYYWKDHQQHEVDFVLKRGSKVVEMIQVAYAVNDPDTARREYRALLKASRDLDCRKATLITWDGVGEEEYEGLKVRVVPLYRWLLS
jgi:predicted AAA+ superfamily ATPase